MPVSIVSSISMNLVYNRPMAKRQREKKMKKDQDKELEKRERRLEKLPLVIEPVKEIDWTNGISYNDFMRIKDD